MFIDMNTSQIFLIVMFILGENIQNHVLVHTSDIESFIFYENTKLLHITLNDLFSAMKLIDAFARTTKIKLLLNIHTSLLKIIKAKHNKLLGMKVDFNTAAKKANNSTVFYEIFQDSELFPENCTMKDIDGIVWVKMIESFKDFLHEIDKLNLGFRKNLVEDFESKIWAPKENDTLRRIFNSRPTRITWYSFMASVHVDGQFVCAGAIIKKFFVITAASCLYELLNPPSAKDLDVIVRVGSEFTTYGGVTVPVTEIFLHPWFDPKTLHHNLAILRMDSKIRIAKKKIRKIAFSKENTTFTSSIFMLGWGAKDELNEPLKFQELSYAYIDIYDLEKCKEIYSSVYVTVNNFCAGFKRRGSGACAKDIGDPAIVDGMLVGVVSYGPPLCGTADAPTVFTRISHYAPWIESIVQRIKVYKQALRAPNPVTPKYSVKRNNAVYHYIRPVNDYPDEITILHEILEDLAKTNGSLIDEVIDESFDKEILNSLQHTTKTDLIHHPLVNKSVVPIHGVHIPEEKEAEKEYQTVSLTTSTLFTYPWQKEVIHIPDPVLDYNEFVAEYEYFKTSTFLTTTVPRLTTRKVTQTTPKLWFTEVMLDRLRGDNHEDSPQTSSSDDSKESKGLSIEMTTAKIFDEPIISSSRESATEAKTPKDQQVLFYIDSELLEMQQQASNKHRKKVTKRNRQIKPKQKRTKKRKGSRHQRFTKMVPDESYEFDYRFNIKIE